MLVLSRKKNEIIRIGDNIEVKVLAVQGDRVRLGIAAPQDVRILRHEILEHCEESLNETKTHAKDTVVTLAETPVREDTLRTGNSRNHITRNHGSRVGRPR